MLWWMTAWRYCYYQSSHLTVFPPPIHTTNRVIYRPLHFWWLLKTATPSVSPFYCRMEPMCCRGIQRRETVSCLPFKITTSRHYRAATNTLPYWIIYRSDCSHDILACWLYVTWSSFHANWSTRTLPVTCPLANKYISTMWLCHA